MEDFWKGKQLEFKIRYEEEKWDIAAYLHKQKCETCYLVVGRILIKHIKK